MISAIIAIWSNDVPTISHMFPLKPPFIRDVPAIFMGNPHMFPLKPPYLHGMSQRSSEKIHSFNSVLFHGPNCRRRIPHCQSLYLRGVHWIWISYGYVKLWYMIYVIYDMWYIYIYWYTIYIDIWYILIYDITWCTMDIQYRRHPDDRNILALGVLFLSAIRSGSWALYVAQFCPRWLVETCRNHVSKRRFVGGLTRFKRDWGVDQTDVYIYI